KDQAIKGAGACQLIARLPVRGRDDLVACLSKPALQSTKDLALILDYQHARHGLTSAAYFVRQRSLGKLGARLKILNVEKVVERTGCVERLRWDCLAQPERP